MDKKKVEIVEVQEVFKKAIFRIELAKLKHQKFDGSMSREIARLNLDRGQCVAALVYDSNLDEVYLVEQFRYPTYGMNDSGWILELPAGMIDDGEKPEDAVCREVHEEMGLEISDPQLISNVYVSPGGTSERIAIYFCKVAEIGSIAEFGGVESEDEDIRIVKLARQQAEAMVANGEIVDAKTVIALQWLRLNL